MSEVIHREREREAGTRKKSEPLCNSFTSLEDKLHPESLLNDMQDII